MSDIKRSIMMPALFFILFVGLFVTVFSTVSPPAKIAMYLIGILTGASLVGAIQVRKTSQTP